MLKCQTLIIGSHNTQIPKLNIGGIELSIDDTGKIKTKDKNGIVKTIMVSISGTTDLTHLEILINDTTQTVNENETMLFFDSDFLLDSKDTEFIIEQNTNKVKIKNNGHFFISYSISLDMYSGNKSTVNAYLKINNTYVDNNNHKVLEKSRSFLFFNSPKTGYGSINNSFLYTGKSNDELSIYLKVSEGNGNFYTIPSSTNFNIFKIQ